MKIGIDFDDVIADTIEMVARQHNEQYGTQFTREDFHVYDWHVIWGGTREEGIRKADTFFEKDQVKEIAPLKGVAEGLAALKAQGHELYIITGRSKRNVAETERWLEHHFLNVFKSVHYAHFYTLDENAVKRSKLEICRELGVDLMLDDNLETALELADAGMKVILFDQPWNRNVALPEGVTRVKGWEEVNF